MLPALCCLAGLAGSTTTDFAVDCTSFPKVDLGMTGECVDLDGKRYRLPFDFSKHAAASSVVNLFHSAVEDWDWHTVKPNKTVIVLQGPKGAGLKSMTITPDTPGGWVPTVTAVVRLRDPQPTK